MNGTAVKAQGKRSVRSLVRLKAGIAATGLCLPIATSAQIATDGTVGPQVQLTGPDFDIHAELGRQVGSNLFHSFQEFQIHTGESATFSGPNDIHNVIGRVTGGDASNIDGTLRSTMPNADVYLINPAGVVFGEQASIDVPGSLHVSTADQVEFADGNVYSAAQPEISVLTVADPVSFGFLRENPADIQVNGSRLEMKTGRTLSLSAGNIRMQGTAAGQGIVAPGGEIQLSTGPDGTIELRNMTLDTSGSPGGQVALQGGNIDLQDSLVLSQTLGNGGGSSVDLEASRTIALDNSGIHAAAAEDGAGGDIRLSAPSIALDNASVLNASTFGSGRGGSIELQTATLEMSGGSRIYNEALAGGDAGSVRITASEHIHIRSPANDPGATEISVDSHGSGAGGALTMQAPSLILDGAFLSASAHSDGSGGSIALSGNTVRLTPGAVISTSSYGAGTGGRLEVEVADLLIDGGNDSTIPTGLYSNALASGDGGSIHIDVERFSLGNGGNLQFATTGPGTGGSVFLSASEQASITSGSVLLGITEGSGNAGNLHIEAGDIEITDSLVDLSNREGSGNGGGISLQATGQLRIDNGHVLTRSYGAGDSGDIDAQAARIDVTRDGRLSTEATGTGEGGNITLRAADISITDGGEVSAEAYLGAPRGGDIVVTATNSLSIVGRNEPPNYPSTGDDRVSTGIFTYVGNIEVTAPDITLSDSGAIAARTHNDNPAGTINVTTERLVLENGGEISTDSRGASFYTGKGGTINVNASESIEIRGQSTGGRRASITSSTRSSGDAGEINVTTPRLLVADGGRIFTSTGVFGEGAAGSILINAGSVELRNEGGVLSSSVGYGGGGNIEIRATDYIEIDGNSAFVSAYGANSGASGTVLLNAPEVRVSDGVISTRNVGALPAGAITIEAQRLYLSEGAEISSTSTSPVGDAGSIDLQISDLIDAEDSLITTQAEQASGGNILLSARTLRLINTPVSATVAGGTGDGGNVIVNTDAFAAIQNSDLTARADQGLGGRIVINSEVFLRDATVDLDASSNVIGNDGVVEINAPELDISATIKELSAEFLDAADLLADTCAARGDRDRSSLVVAGRGGVAPGPDDYLMGTLPTTNDARSRQGAQTLWPMVMDQRLTADCR